MNATRLLVRIPTLLTAASSRRVEEPTGTEGQSADPAPGTYSLDPPHTFIVFEAYIECTLNLTTNDGEVTNVSTRAFLAGYMKDFHAFVAPVHTVLPREDRAA